MQFAIPSIVFQLIFICFCIVIAIQLFYYLYFFLRLAIFNKKEKAQSVEYPVSVIVCAKNEAAKLADNLPGVLAQTYKTTHEVIVVNDNSEDDTRYLLDELYKLFRQLNIINLNQEAMLISGKKFPLSVGIKSAKYELLILTDADCIPASEDWIQLMQSAFNTNTEIVLGYGAYKKYPGLLNKIIRFETFFSAMQYLSFALAKMPYMGVGRNLSYKRDLFLRNKGFASINHLPSGDDDLFINKVATAKNTAIVIDHAAHTISEPKKDFGNWVRQKNRHFTTGKFYKSKHKFLLGLHSISQFAVYPFLVLCLLTSFWWMALSAYAVRLIILMIVWYKSMQKLNEKDLFKYFLLFDIGLIFHYLLFLPSLWKKPKKTWN
jgi:glycosyltransferase involved in cell wall biosynthesis